MRVPAYHLRLNKMVERLLFVELLHRLDGLLPAKIEQHTYVGLGGPYLEDFNLIHGTFGNEDMISLEIYDWVLTRQELNQPHSAVKLRLQSTAQFIESFTLDEQRYVIWFDYSKQDWDQQIYECCELLRKLPALSLFKVTFSGLARKEKLEETADRLSRMFADYGPFEARDVSANRISYTLYSILRRAIAGAIPDTEEKAVKSLASYRYDDGTPILTVTMTLGPKARIDELVRKARLRSWRFSDINWRGPREIALPSLGLREKLAVDRLLPAADSQTILDKLGLRLAERRRDSLRQLDNYLQFYRQVPQFLRVTL